jgi:hypothetical protein
MRTEIALPKKFEIYLSDLDNHVLIENGPSGVVISATRDNISDSRKAFFIRHLAAEGFIPERYEWFCEPVEDGFLGVQWVAISPSKEINAEIHVLRKLCTRRNAWYGCLFIMWLLFFIWSVRHIHHGLGL